LGLLLPGRRWRRRVCGILEGRRMLIRGRWWEDDEERWRMKNWWLLDEEGRCRVRLRVETRRRRKVGLEFEGLRSEGWMREE